MTHKANIDAIMHFHQHIWPLIRQRVPDAQWMIVGAWPPPEILALDGHQGVCVYSNVPDVKPFIRESAVYIAPLRIGSGVKVKIMEALAMGKAIVATPVAAEGMGLLVGQNVEIAELDDQFADVIIRLWADSTCRSQMEQHARQTAIERFGIDAGARTLTQIYQQLGICKSQ
jgi:glycosyltransferase involved in cell wall biosynthesis